MKIKSLLAILAFFLLAPLQVQTAAQSTDLNWEFPLADDSPAQENLEGLQSAVWRPMNGTGLPPLTQLNINVVLADPIKPEIVYLGTSADNGEYGGVYRTTDGGKYWSPFNTGLAAHSSINMMAITPDGGVLYTRDSNYATMGLFRTPTGNPAWTKLTTPSGSDANSIFSMYINSSFVYIGLYNDGMYKSSHQGDDWVKMIGSYQNTTHVIAGVSTDINLMYAAVITPYKTIDGGENWEHLDSFNSGVNPCGNMGYVDTIAIDPTNTDVILVGDDKACLVRSDDGGNTLALVYAGVGVSRVVFDPRDPNLAYLSAITRGTNHNGVMKSSDNGKTWTDYNSGLPWKGTSGFELGPGAAGKPSVLYAGMTRKGIYTTAPSDTQYAIFLPVVRR